MPTEPVDYVEEQEKKLKLPRPTLGEELAQQAFKVREARRQKALDDEARAVAAHKALVESLVPMTLQNAERVITEAAARGEVESHLEENELPREVLEAVSAWCVENGITFSSRSQHSVSGPLTIMKFKLPDRK